jgi:hypothetical protein
MKEHIVFISLYHIYRFLCVNYNVEILCSDVHLRHSIFSYFCSPKVRVNSCVLKIATAVATNSTMRTSVRLLAIVAVIFSLFAACTVAVSWSTEDIEVRSLYAAVTDL